MPKLNRLTSFCFLSALLATQSLAQQTAPEGLLAGPPVDLDTLPGVERTFGGEQSMVPQMGARPVPIQVFTRAIRDLARHDDEAIRLTPEQGKEFRAMFEQFRKDAQRARQRKQADRPQGREQAPEPQQRRARPTQDLPEDPRDRAQVIQRMMGNSPQPADIQQAIWAKLSDKQREVVRAAIDKHEKQATEKAGKRKLDEFKKSIGENLNNNRRTNQLANAFNADGSVNLDALPERLRERLEPMSKSRRREIIQRLIDRQNQARDRRPRGESKDSPSMDGVDVPAAK